MRCCSIQQSKKLAAMSNSRAISGSIGNSGISDVLLVYLKREKGVQNDKKLVHCIGIWTLLHTAYCTVTHSLRRDTEGRPVHLLTSPIITLQHQAPYLPNNFESCVSHKLINIGIVLPRPPTLRFPWVGSQRTREPATSTLALSASSFTPCLSQCPAGRKPQPSSLNFIIHLW